MNTTSLYWVFYDAQCGLCQRARVFLQQWSRHPDAICFLDIHEEASQAILRDYGVSIENALGAMHVIEWTKRRVFVAEVAVAVLLRQCVMPWAFVGWILQQPALAVLTRPVYRWVAARRHRFLPPLPVEQENASSCEGSCHPF
jgi:predicted DCC family thiol-disulfide oxidoreductase YuxK